MADITVVTVTLEDREDGGIRVKSDSLPGLILDGKNREEIVEYIAPAICALFRYRGHTVKVRAAKPTQAFLSGPNPRDIDIHVEHGETQRQFVVEFEELADAA